MDEVNIGVSEVDAPAEVTDEKPEKVVRTDAIRAGDRLRQIKSRSAKRAREKVVAYKWDSSQEPTRSEALAGCGKTQNFCNEATRGASIEHARN